MRYDRRIIALPFALALTFVVGCGDFDRKNYVVLHDDEPASAAPASGETPETAENAETAKDETARPPVEAAPKRKTREDISTDPIIPKFESNGVVAVLSGPGIYKGAETPEEKEQWKRVKVIRGEGFITAPALETFALATDLTEFLWVDGVVSQDALEALDVIATSPKLKKVRLKNLNEDFPALVAASEYVIARFAYSPNLVELDLSGAEISSGCVKTIAQPHLFPKLERLNLYGVKFAPSRKHGEIVKWDGDELAKALVPFAKRLTWLNLDDDALTSDSVDSLTKFERLEFLHVGRSSLTDADVERLACLKNLKKIHITRSKATEEGAERLRAALPDCEVVSQPEE